MAPFLDRPPVVTNLSLDYRNPQDFVVYRPHGSGDCLFLNFITPVHVDLPEGRVLTAPNACLIFTPGRRQWYSGIDRAYIHHWLHVDWSTDLERLIDSLKLPTNVPFYPPGINFVRPVLHEIFDEAHVRRERWQELGGLSFVRLLMLLARSISEGDSPYTRVQSRTRTRIEAVRKEVASHPERAWTVAALARRAGLSASHFTSAHRAFFGENPKRFLLDTRVTHACHLLTNRALTVSEVAARAGFSSVFHFSRSFKRLMGCPPSRYQSGSARPVPDQD